MLQNGGKVCISGSGIYNNLKTGNNRSRGFLSDVLGIQDFGERTGGVNLASADERFLPTTGSLRLSSTLTSWNSRKVAPVSLSGKKEQTLPLLLSGSNGDRVMAIITRPFYSAGEIISLGFPFSSVASTQQPLLMEALLKQM